MDGVDERFMRRAIQLARRGWGWVSPNPMVGAVIVKGGEIVGEGYHRRFGGDHAEIEAIRRAGEEAKGATLYVNLEPCCHWGKTPPCVDAILKAGIKRVVVANSDPNPQVKGKGMKILRDGGVEVEEGVLSREGRRLNRAYFKWREEGMPFVTLKWAQSLDGRIATSEGDARWISGERALRYAHLLRARNDAVLVGAGTVIADDPRLTVRLLKGKNPLRVVIDSRLRIPHEAHIFNDEATTLVATTSSANPERLRELVAKGVEVMKVRDKGGRVDLREVLEELARRGITSLLVEGGGEVITSFLREGLVDYLVVIIAPLVMGKGKEAVGDLGVRKLKEAKGFSTVRVRRLGEDLIWEGEREARGL